MTSASCGASMNLRCVINIRAIRDDKLNKQLNATILKKICGVKFKTRSYGVIFFMSSAIFAKIDSSTESSKGPVCP
jgi:hypothetical protein